MILTAVWILLMIFSAKCFTVTGYIIFKLICAYCIYRVFFRWLVAGILVYYKEKKSFDGEWTRKIIFKESAVTIIEDDSWVKIDYKDVRRVKENGDCIRIMLRGGKNLRVYKSGFDSWNSGFISFMERKCREKNGQTD